MDARPAIFLDKDGTLVEDVPFNVAPAQLRWTVGAIEALRLWQAAGYAVVLITNQAGIALGRFSEEAFLRFMEYLHTQLQELGIALDAFYYCPHHPDASVAAYAGPCRCRKPHPGLVLRAARELNLDLARSWFVGDILHDVEAGRRAGCKTILLDNGNETEWELGPQRRPHALAADLHHAAQITLGLRNSLARKPWLMRPLVTEARHV